MVEVLSSPLSVPESTTDEQRPKPSTGPHVAPTVVADIGSARSTARALDGRPSLSVMEVPGHLVDCIKRSREKSPQLWWQLVGAVFVVVYCGSLLALRRCPPPPDPGTVGVPRAGRGPLAVDRRPGATGRSSRP